MLQPLAPPCEPASTSGTACPSPVLSESPAPSAMSGRRTSTLSQHDTPLLFLQGVWRGRGKGIYPTIKSFEYNEEIIVTGNPNSVRPVLHYKQRTWSKHANPRPMHEETGWIRALAMTNEQGCQRVEWVLAAQNGVTTVEEGVVHDHPLHPCIQLHSTAITRSSTARTPYATEFHRVFEVDLTQDPPTLHITMDMATTRTPLTRHLEAWLVRTQPQEPHAYMLHSPSMGMRSESSSGGLNNQDPLLHASGSQNSWSNSTLSFPQPPSDHHNHNHAAGMSVSRAIGLPPKAVHHGHNISGSTPPQHGSSSAAGTSRLCCPHSSHEDDDVLLGGVNGSHANGGEQPTPRLMPMGSSNGFARGCPAGHDS